MSLQQQATDHVRGKVLYDIWRNETQSLTEQFDQSFVLRSWEEIEEAGKDFWALVASQYEEQRSQG